jgi:hypothetical protein
VASGDKKLVEELLQHSAVNDVGVVFKMPDPEGGASVLPGGWHQWSTKRAGRTRACSEVPGTRILLGDGSMSEACLTQAPR